MANRYWVATADSIWGNDANWSATKGGAGGASYPTSADAVTFSNSWSTYKCSLAAHQACASLTTDDAVDWDGTLDTSTYNLICTGNFVLNSATSSGVKLIIGASSDIGLQIGGEFRTDDGNVKITLDNASKISVAGNITIFDAALFTTNNRGILTITGSSTYNNPNAGNFFRIVTINSGVVSTPGNNARYTQGLSANTEFHLLGTLAQAGNNVYIGAGNGGVFEIGNSAAWTGNVGSIAFVRNHSGCTASVTTNALAFAGNIRHRTSLNNEMCVIPMNTPNASVEFSRDQAGAQMTMHTKAGTLICASYTNALQSGDTIPFVNDGNMNIETTGNMTLVVVGVGGSYTRSETATFTMKPTTGTVTISAGTLTIENLVINGSGGAIVQHDYEFITKTLTVLTGTFTLGTLNLTSQGVTTISETLIIGVSAGTGLTTAGLTVNATGIINLQIGSIIKTSGAIAINNSATYTTPGTGKILVTASTTISMPNRLHSPYWLEQVNAADTITWSASVISRIEGYTHTVILRGANILSGQVEIGATNTFNFASTASFSGTSSVIFYIASAATITWDGTFSNTGNCNFTAISGVDTAAMPGNYLTCSQVRFRALSGGAQKIIPRAGIYKINYFDVSKTTVGTLEIDNSVNDPDYEISSTIDLFSGSGDGTIWTRGDGTITGKGSTGTQSWNFRGYTVEEIILDCAGATKSILNNFTTKKLSGTGGTIQSSVSGTQRVITCEEQSAVTGITFKDISVGAANKINAKSGGNTNLGNCLGIVFADAMGAM